MSLHWTGEAQLMGYGESDSSGAWIKLQVLAEDLDHFRGLKGTTFDLTLENPNQPIGKQVKDSKPKGGNLAKEAGKICHVTNFQIYAKAKLDATNLSAPAMLDSVTAAMFLRAACGVESRAELDHNATAAKAFRDLMHNYSKTQE